MNTDRTYHLISYDLASWKRVETEARGTGTPEWKSGGNIVL
jgi:hypothetical protein